MAKIIFSNGKTKELTPTNGKSFTLKELKDVVGGWIEVIRLQNEYMVLNQLPLPKGRGLLNEQ